LKDNFKLGEWLVSPYLNEACDTENNSFFNYAFPNDNSLPENYKKMTIGDLKGTPDLRGVLQCVHPFSPTCGMDDGELQEKLSDFPPLFILMGMTDDLTNPATQGGALAWRLQKMNIANWRMFTYENARHVIHRFQNDDLKAAFRQIFSDILSIAQGNPQDGTQELDVLAKYTPKSGFGYNPNSSKNTHCFIRFKKDGKIKSCHFNATDCGKEIFEAGFTKK
jgi:acetyl esterase/lipase